MGFRIPSLISTAYWWTRQRQLQIRHWAALAEQQRFRGASLAIVGNAGYLAGIEQGERIDGHDLVLRMNNFQLEGLQAQVGTRLNIFISTYFRDIQLDNPLIAQAEYLVSSVPNNFRKHGLKLRHGKSITHGLERLGRREIFVPPRDDFDQKRAHIGQYPTTGAMALYLAVEVLLPLCGSIYVTGFSFFEGRSHYFSDEQVRPTNHNPVREREVLADLLRPHYHSGRITFDDHMTTALGFRKSAA